MDQNFLLAHLQHQKCYRMNTIKEFIPHVNTDAIKQIEFLQTILPQEVFQKLCCIISRKINTQMSKADYYLEGNSLVRPYIKQIEQNIYPKIQKFLKCTNPDLQQEIVRETPYLAICMRDYLICKAKNLKSIPIIPCI